MRVAVNSHALPIYKKNRIASLLCIFETIIVAYENHCLCVYKKVSHLPSQLGIFVFTFTVKRFHIYGPYYI